MPATTVIGAQHVDSFQLKATSNGNRCVMRACPNAGRVMLFYSLEPGKQEKARICVGHALSLANEVLNKYKFKVTE